MALINVTLPSDGETADASDISSPINTIVSEFNGNIDNANIKTGAAIATSKLASDEGIVAGMISDAAVTPEKLLAGTGTTHVWQDFTPSWANVSGGTSNYAKYIQIGKTVHFRAKYTLAGAGVSGSIVLTLPVEANSQYDVASVTPINGGVVFRDDSTSTTKLGIMTWQTSTTVALRPIKVDVTYAESLLASSTIPFTWAANDIILCEGTYEAA
jgi:hypothetical protein